jgi:hypothetical protein
MPLTQLGFWDYETETAVGEPDSGGVRATDPITVVCLSTVDHDGGDHAAALGALAPGDLLEFRERTNALKWVRLEVAALVEQPGSPPWVQADVAYHSGSSVDQPKRGDDLVLTLWTGGSTPSGSPITVEDYERLTGHDVPPEDEERVQALLDAAWAAVQGATGQTLSRERTTELVMLDGWRQTLMLGQVPIIEAEPDDTLVVTGPDGEVVPRDHYTVLPESGELKHCDCHPWPPGCYEVTYTHGFDPLPADLVMVVVGSVDSVLTPVGGVTAQSVGSYSVSFAATRTAEDLASVGGSVVDRYRIPSGP